MQATSIKAALQDSSVPNEKAFIRSDWVGSDTTFPVNDRAIAKFIANVANLATKILPVLMLIQPSKASRPYRKLLEPRYSTLGQHSVANMSKTLVCF